MTDDDDAARRRVVDSWYAGTFYVGHSGLEFKIDCGHNLYEGQLVKEYYRIIAHPIHARQLFRLLGVGLIRWNDTFGPLDDPAADRPPPP